MKSQAMMAAAALALAACTQATGDTAQSSTPADAPASTSAPTSGFSPTDLAALIVTRGPDAALSDLMAQPEDPRWQALLAGVSSGDTAWLAAAAPLVPSLDGEAAESLFSALGDALAHQPAAVLAAVGADGMESACQPYPPEMTAAKQQALRAIGDDSPVAALRDECLTILSGEPT